jgi:hypothetical protein
MRRAAKVLFATVATLLAATASALIPTPTVTGPIPSETPGSPSRNYTWWATDIVLENYGYVEQEFFFDGLANRYDAPNPAGFARCTAMANIVESNIPFRSRMRVIRPTDPAKFNGTVVVEWTNVTNGYDVSVWWQRPKAFYLREGYAYVEVSAQNAGINGTPFGLRNWSPTRYGSLNVNANGTITGDALSYDIFSQAAQAVRNVPVVMGGLPVGVVIGVGESQSASRLGVYINAIHSRDPVYDGLIPSMGGERICNNAERTKVIKVLSEQEANNQERAMEDDTSKFRVWSVAGMSHADQQSLVSRAALFQRDQGLLAQDLCATPARSRVIAGYIYGGAVAAMDEWLRKGTPPAIGPRFVYNNPPAGGIQRDAFGNAIGGIRTAEIDVPVAKEAGDTCGNSGTHVPFSPETINALYPTHGDYVAKVRAAALDSVAKGFVPLGDAEDQIDRAIRSIWGMQLTCGPLCADVRQFPLNPSSMLLRMQTEFFLIKRSEALLLPLLDATTRAIAQGYTLPARSAASKQKFAHAAGLLERYIAAVNHVLEAGLTKPETAKIMIDQANTLRHLLLEEAERG